jgi:transposase-like protein
LLVCKERGLEVDPELAIADGALGFWKALPKIWPKTRGQRCWVHKTANVLDKIAKGQQPKAKEMLHDIWMAASHVEAEKAFDLFLKTWEAKFPKATECLAKGCVYRPRVRNSSYTLLHLSQQKYPSQRLISRVLMSTIQVPAKLNTP